jgi:hypothetical protein
VNERQPRYGGGALDICKEARMKPQALFLSPFISTSAGPLAPFATVQNTRCESMSSAHLWLLFGLFPFASSKFFHSKHLQSIDPFDEWLTLKGPRGSKMSGLTPVAHSTTLLQTRTKRRLGPASTRFPGSLFPRTDFVLCISAQLHASSFPEFTLANSESIKESVVG